MSDDVVCSECGSDVVFAEVETTTMVDTARTFAVRPYACSNARCEFADPTQIPMWGWPMELSEWEAQQADS